MTSYLLDELEWLEKAATPKEWRVKNVNESKFDYMWGPEYKPVFYIEAGHGLGEGGNSPTESNLVNITPKQVHMSEGNVKLIVALRNAAPSLFQSLRSLMAENEALKNELKEAEKDLHHHIVDSAIGQDRQWKQYMKERDTLKKENEALKQQSLHWQEVAVKIKKERDEYGRAAGELHDANAEIEAQLKVALDALKAKLERTKEHAMNARIENDKVEQAVYDELLTENENLRALDAERLEHVETLELQINRTSHTRDTLQAQLNVAVGLIQLLAKQRTPEEFEEEENDEWDHVAASEAYEIMVIKARETLAKLKEEE